VPLVQRPTFSVKWGPTRGSTGGMLLFHFKFGPMESHNSFHKILSFEEDRPSYKESSVLNHSSAWNFFTSCIWPRDSQASQNPCSTPKDFTNQQTNMMQTNLIQSPSAKKGATGIVMAQRWKIPWLCNGKDSRYEQSNHICCTLPSCLQQFLHTHCPPSIHRERQPA
jgi:hypothetical protein